MSFIRKRKNLAPLLLVERLEYHEEDSWIEGESQLELRTVIRSKIGESKWNIDFLHA